MKISLTGHRTQFFEQEGDGFILGVRKLLNRAYTALRPDSVITGLCYGFDVIGAEEAQALDIDTHGYSPFPEFGKNWSPEHKESKEKVIEKLTSYRDVCPDYKRSCFHERDQAMVDDCDIVFSLLHPDANKGGTYYTVQYAKLKGKPVYNFWPDTDDKILDYIEQQNIINSVLGE